MSIDELIKILEKFNWCLLKNMYGCAHSSIIGFISSEWIRQDAGNSVMDGAPSDVVGKGRKEQKNSDILLFKNKTPVCVVEVESTIANYKTKITSILGYLNNQKRFNGLKCGLLIMTNAVGKKDEICSHNWKIIESEINKNNNIVFLSIKRKEHLPGDSTQDRLRENTPYYHWDIKEIVVWRGNNTEESQNILLSDMRLS